jgi:hypothetical protein
VEEEEEEEEEEVEVEVAKVGTCWSFFCKYA